MDAHHRPALLSRLLTSEAAEGVISTAIAVLVMAFIGAAMWVAFDRIFDGAAQTVEAEVGRIGSS
jgi:uncharacterized membrane protein (DUF485 family)